MINIFIYIVNRVLLDRISCKEYLLQLYPIEQKWTYMIVKFVKHTCSIAE